MPRPPTRFSRVSIGYVSSSQTLPDKDAGDTGAVLSVYGDYAFVGDETFTGDKTQTGDYTRTGDLYQTGNSVLTGTQTISSTQSVGGQTTATGGIAVGGGEKVVAISTTTAEIDFGSLTSVGAGSSTTVGLSGATRGDTIIVSPDSEWSSYDAISITAWSGDTTGEVNVAANAASSITAIDPAAVVFRITRLNFSAYI